MPAPSKASAPRSKVIYNAGPVGRHLAALKAKHEAASTEESKDATNTRPWWYGVIDIEWPNPRKSSTTQWISIYYTDETGVRSKLFMRINGERHNGQIMPTTDKELAELMAASNKNHERSFKKRDKKPSVTIQKWSRQVKTDEDGVTICTDDDGKPILPSDDSLSDYFRASSLVNEAFQAEARERVDLGLELVAAVADMKKKNKAVTAAAVLEEFNKEKPRRAGDMILSSESVATIRRSFKSPDDIKLLTGGAATVPTTKIANAVQEYISLQNKKNPGCALPNPMTRIAMNFDKDTGVAQMAFFDKSKPYNVNGRQKYEMGKVDGAPINADNIHKFVKSGSSVDGIVAMDSVCYSSLAISMPVKIEVAVVDPPVSFAIEYDDVYGDYDDGPAPTSDAPTGDAPTGAAPSSDAPTADAPAGNAPTGDAPKEEAKDENFDELLGDLGVGK